jgi:putative addiction module component (TIGR02574 family)
MATAAQLLSDAMQLPPDEREELAARLHDSVEPPPGIDIDDREEIERRADAARRGEPGIAWEDVQRGLRR